MSQPIFNMAFNDPSTYTDLRSPLPHWLGLTYVIGWIYSMMMRDIQEYFTKGCYFLLALSWIIISGGSQLPCCRNTQAAQGRSMGGEELRPNGNSCISFQLIWEKMWIQILQPQSNLKMTAVLADTFTETSWETLS